MMRRSLINIIQNTFGIAKYELSAVSIFLIGLIVATIATFVNRPNTDDGVTSDNSKQLLSIIATKQQETYTGSDMNGYQDSTILAQNPIIEEGNRFTSNKKITLPSDVKININTASKASLMKLAGVGEATAEKIIDYRKDVKFQKIEDIMDVQGIGKKKFEKMKINLKV